MLWVAANRKAHIDIQASRTGIRKNPIVLPHAHAVLSTGNMSLTLHFFFFFCTVGSVTDSCCPVFGVKVEVEVTSRLMVGQSVNMSWCRAHSRTCDQKLLPIGRLLSENCGLLSVGRPLWREDRSAVCSAITQRAVAQNL
jgi:hypothetical protein